GDVDEAQRAAQHEEQVPESGHSAGIADRVHVASVGNGVLRVPGRYAECGGESFGRSSYPGQLNYGRSELAAMRIGILGSGLMGGKLGTLFARAGHDVVFSYARSREKLTRLARDAGDNARAGTPGEAARDADAVLLAVHWSRMDDVLKQAGDLSGK